MLPQRPACVLSDQMIELRLEVPELAVYRPFHENNKTEFCVSNNKSHF